MPTPFIDEFWHAHILDTVTYHSDCEQLFGSYQHHFPSFPDDPPQKAETLRADSDATRRLFHMHFGIEPWADEEIRNFQNDSPE